jgi:hypothetical protein
LANNLTGCSGSGLRVGGKGITIDLNGNRIVGDLDGFDSGIVNATGFFDGHRDLTIRNGVIKNFDVGVSSNGKATTLAHLTLGGNRIGAVLSGGKIKDSVFVGASTGVLVQGRTTLANNTIAGNDSSGLQIDGTAVVTKNRIAGNGGDGVSGSIGDGSELTKNVIDGNVDDGLDLSEDLSDSEVSRNTIRGSGGDAYEDEGRSNKVTDNLARGNGYHGGSDGSEGGFDASNATKPKGSGNKVIGNDQGIAPCSPAKLC